MCITVSDLDALMSHTVSDSNSREAQLDQERNVAVTQIVNADSFQACRFHTPVHLMVQIALGYGENSLVWLLVVQHTEILLHLLAKKIRHFNGTVAFLGFRLCDDVLSLDTLIGLVDAELAVLEIEVRSCES